MPIRTNVLQGCLFGDSLQSLSRLSHSGLAEMLKIISEMAL